MHGLRGSYPLPTCALMRALRLLGLVAVAGLTVAQNTTSTNAHCIQGQGQFNWVRGFGSAKWRFEKPHCVHVVRCSIR